MRKPQRLLVGIGAAAALTMAGAATAAATQLVALTGDKTLILIDYSRPAVVAQATVSGISGRLLGIDVRPADGQLYGVVADGTVVTIDGRANATFKTTLNPPLLLPVDPRASVDFNPSADRLRIIFANDGQNLRANVDTGELLTDVPLNYAPNPFGLAPPTVPQVIAAAYTNSAVGTAPGAKGTILFDVDDRSDAIFAQVPANAGTLNAVGAQLGITPGQIGFDIATDRRGRNTAWLINGNRLHRPDLLSGLAGEGKRIRGLTAEVRDLAVLPSRR
jgi:Domain of unknown function (DUF4394)